jgi:hypothetical protein
MPNVFHMNIHLQTGHYVRWFWFYMNPEERLEVTPSSAFLAFHGNQR